MSSIILPDHVSTQRGPESSREKTLYLIADVEDRVDKIKKLSNDQPALCKRVQDQVQATKILQSVRTT